MNQAICDLLSDLNNYVWPANKRDVSDKWCR